MKDFKMSGTNMNQLLTDLTAVQQGLNDSYELLSLLMSCIDTEQAWKGKAKDTFWAYMGLLEQYHASFTDNSENNPVKLAIDALKELEENVNNFYTDYQQYIDMEGIG